MTKSIKRGNSYPAVSCCGCGGGSPNECGGQHRLATCDIHESVALGEACRRSRRCGGLASAWRQAGKSIRVGNCLSPPQAVSPKHRSEDEAPPSLRPRVARLLSPETRPEYKRR